jgi:hypothetical protein
VGRTIAHGESIGVRRVFLPVVVVRTRWRLAGPDFLCCQGLVACHLAAEGLVDFVVAGAWWRKRFPSTRPHDTPPVDVCCCSRRSNV